MSPSLVTGDVLIDGATIAGVSSSPVGEDPSRETIVIDGGNRVLMPGMSDAHVHLVGNANSYVDMVAGTESHIALWGSPGKVDTVSLIAGLFVRRSRIR